MSSNEQPANKPATKTGETRVKNLQQLGEISRNELEVRLAKWGLTMEEALADQQVAYQVADYFKLTPELEEQFLAAATSGDSEQAEWNRIKAAIRE